MTVWPLSRPRTQLAVLTDRGRLRSRSPACALSGAKTEWKPPGLSTLRAGKPRVPGAQSTGARGSGLPGVETGSERWLRGPRSKWGDGVGESRTPRVGAGGARGPRGVGAPRASPLLALPGGAQSLLPSPFRVSGLSLGSLWLRSYPNFLGLTQRKKRFVKIAALLLNNLSSHSLFPFGRQKLNIDLWERERGNGEEGEGRGRRPRSAGSPDASPAAQGQGRGDVREESAAESTEAPLSGGLGGARGLNPDGRAQTARRPASGLPLPLFPH